ncbi:RDD family protein [Reyranella sp. CPCC 100927]|uniref:RDD family protein n=1 Tax=Reyranella sp. CPCC 100927 TaxID=2599616 RepID=UPI0011B7A0DA|nr:RDD family protein [Reyranella sp. CPCC 100927]TWT14128.1 RDD family protein [Reyranella sp. CPCC 100927]
MSHARHELPTAAIAGSTAADLPPAGFWLRFVAAVIDAAIIGGVIALLIAIYGVAAALKLSDRVDWGELPGLAFAFALYTIFPLTIIGVPLAIIGGWIYEVLMLRSARGATLGKMAVGVRVVAADGSRLTLGRSAAGGSPSISPASSWRSAMSWRRLPAASAPCMT